MTIREWFGRIGANEDLNFLLTNRIPRQTLTRFVGWLSKREHPWVSASCIAIWKFFSDLDLREAKETHFKSMHACFTRELKDGVRPVDMDPGVLASPCDAIVGAGGSIDGISLIQAKGFPYTLQDLLGDEELVNRYRDGTYVTLRLTSSMYHRFHAPYDCTIEQVNYISGDTWNVNPIALKRVEKLFCKNVRAVVQSRLPNNSVVTMVPVAAVLVASLRLRFLDVLLHLKYQGPNVIRCHHEAKKGDELGWFEHGSTIIVFAPRGFTLCDSVKTGERIRMGQRLMNLNR